MTTPVEWFLIRHGLSSASSRRQRLETELGPHGRWQALNVAEHKLSQYPINRLLTSPLPRATETAIIIGKIIGRTAIKVRDLREMERPENIYGARHSSQHNLEFKEAWKTALANSNLDWKHEGKGESMRELICRVDRLERQLPQELPGQKLVLVGHAVNLAFLLARIIRGAKATPEEIVALARQSFLRHGGLAHLRFEDGGWNLIHFDRS